MFDDNQLVSFNKALQRIFSLPVTRSTFREMQNTILSITKGDQEASKKCIETLLTGQEDGKPVKGNHWQEIVARFSIPAWVAKDVHDKGEFLNLITSDILTQKNSVMFSNRVRRVDGKELHLVTDLESTLQVLQHFANRVQEASKIEAAKESFQKQKEHLEALSAQLKAIAKEL